MLNFLLGAGVAGAVFVSVYLLRGYLPKFKLQLLAFALMGLSFLQAQGVDVIGTIQHLTPDEYDWLVPFGVGCLIWALRELTTMPGRWAPEAEKVEAAADVLTQAPNELSQPVVTDQLRQASTPEKVAIIKEAVAASEAPTIARTVANGKDGHE